MRLGVASPNRRSWVALDVAPVAILAFELAAAAVLFAIGVVFVLTVYYAFVTVSVWRVALWAAVAANAAGALVAAARLGGRDRAGAVMHAAGLVGNVVALTRPFGRCPSRAGGGEH
jgi:hypothetical protein